MCSNMFKIKYLNILYFSLQNFFVETVIFQFIMISFFLYYFTVGKIIYNFADFNPTRYPASIFLRPLDVAEIRVPHGYGTFFDVWYGVDLFLFVETDSIYGPFDSNSGLAAVFFKTLDYDLRFVNEGPDVINVSFLFLPFVPERERGKLPIHAVMEPGQEIDNLKSPFIYYIDHSGSKIVMIIMSVILVIFCVLPFF